MKITYTNKRRDLIDIVANDFPSGSSLFSPRDFKIWLPVCLALLVLYSVYVGFSDISINKGISIFLYWFFYLFYAFIFITLYIISLGSLNIYFSSSGSNILWSWLQDDKKKFFISLSCIILFMFCALAIRDFLIDYFPKIDLFLYFTLLLPTFYHVIFWKQKKVEVELHEDSFTIDWGDIERYNKMRYPEGQKVNFADVSKYIKTSDTLSIYSGPLNKVLLVIPHRAFESKKDFEYFTERVTSEVRLKKDKIHV